MEFDFNNPSDEKISIEIKDGNLLINKGKGWADRNNSMERLLLTVKDNLDLSKDKKFIINTGDNPINNGLFPYPVLSNSTKSGYSDIPIPCFIYDHWNEVKISSWQETIKELLSKGSQPPTNNKAIWIGAPVTQKRVEAFHYFNSHKELTDFWLMNWEEVRNEIPEARYLSLTEMQDYKILYDIPGFGFSARTCYFFYMQRPVIKLWDEHIMWFQQHLTDNSIIYAETYDDMISFTKTLLSDKELYDEVVKNTLEIGHKYLNKDYALKYLTEVINNL
jgi:hypothetical protein